MPHVPRTIPYICNFPCYSAMVPTAISVLRIAADRLPRTAAHAQRSTQSSYNGAYRLPFTTPTVCFLRSAFVSSCCITYAHDRILLWRTSFVCARTNARFVGCVLLRRRDSVSFVSPRLDILARTFVSVIHPTRILAPLVLRHYHARAFIRLDFCVRCAADCASSRALLRRTT